MSGQASNAVDALLPAAFPPETRVSVRGLRKCYDGVAAVADVGFDVAAGEVLGLLGPNGAGKTTILESCAGLTRPDSGEVRICGNDMRSRAPLARERLGVVLQATGLQEGITPLEALRAFGALYRRRVDAPELLQRFDLAAVARRRVGHLSGGERQRLFLALAFVNDPAVVLLDEPTAQLDPPMRREFHDLIRQMKREGRALLLATHDMEEAGALCDRLLVLNAGRVVAAGAPAELLATQASALRVVVRTDAAIDVAWLAPCTAIEAPAAGVAGDAGGGGADFTTHDLNAALTQLSAALSARGVRITRLDAGHGGLEELMLKLSRADAAAPARRA